MRKSHNTHNTCTQHTQLMHTHTQHTQRMHTQHTQLMLTLSAVVPEHGSAGP